MTVSSTHIACASPRGDRRRSLLRRLVAAFFGAALPAVLGGCSTPAPSPRELGVPDAVARAGESVVKVRCFLHGEPIAFGSGLLLEPGHVATAAHVVADGDRWEIEDARGQRVPVHAIAARSTAWDVALLDVDAPADSAFLWHSLSLENGAEPGPGDSLWVVGRKSGFVPTRADWSSPNAPWVGFLGGIEGDSGGGVFDTRGSLVGMLVVKGESSFAVTRARLAAVLANPGERIVYPERVEGHPANAIWGLLAQRAGDWKQATGFLRAALAERPGDFLTGFALGETLLQMGDAAGAVEVLQGTVKSRPGNAAALNNLGMAFERVGKPERASESYRRALAIDAKDAGTHHNLGVALYALNDLEGAKREFQASLSFDSTAGGPYAGLGWIMLHEGRRRDAGAFAYEAKRRGADVHALEAAIAQASQSR